MVALYVISAEAAAGKTAICAGIGRHLQGEGKKVGFLKPVLADKKPEGGDGDAAFMKHLLALPETVDSLCPLIGRGKGLADKARQAYIEVAQNKDVVIVEGWCGQSPDDSSSESASALAEALKAKVVIVEGYSGQPAAAEFPGGYRGFGKNLLGIVLNKVPVSQLKKATGEASAELDKEGIKILGVIPEDRTLLAITVAQLASSVQGEILSDADKSAELVENIMLGAMYADSGLEYFGRKSKKAAVIRDDRPDMQMAALETATKCLVISGGTEPIDYVRNSAGSKGVPIIQTGNDTGTIVESIEDALGKARFNQEKKLSRLSEIMGRCLDFQAIDKGLGI